MATALEYLRELVSLNGVSGAEEDVIRAVVRLVRPLVDTVEVDPFGNVIAVRNAASPDSRRVAVAVHTDEVGLRVAKIEDDGFLRFEKVGGLDNRVLLGQRVWVGTAQGRVLGVIGTKSAHFLSPGDRERVPDHAELYIDVGARVGDEARDMGIEVGSPAGYVGDLTPLGDRTGRYAAHALDDRVGCAVLLATLDELRGQDLPATVVGLFTTQEEVGLRGAQAAIAGQEVDLGIAVDTTAADDTPDTGGRRLRIGVGPAVKVVDARLLAHPAVRRGMLAAAEAEGVPVQREILMGISTDAAALQFGGAGIPAGTLSVATRYTHSPVEVLDEGDLEGAVKVLRRFLLAVPDLDLRFTAVE